MLLYLTRGGSVMRVLREMDGSGFFGSLVVRADVGEERRWGW